MQNQDGWFGNPANSGKIKVQVAYIKEPLVISIFNIEGRILYQTKSSARLTEINISEFDKGLYLVKVQNRDAYNRALILLE